MQLPKVFLSKILKNKAKTNEMIFGYIEIFYNGKRKHSYYNYLSPNKFEEIGTVQKSVSIG